MTLKEQIARHNTTMYRLAKDSGVPYSTINDICTGKTSFYDATNHIHIEASQFLAIGTL